MSCAKGFVREKKTRCVGEEGGERKEEKMREFTSIVAITFNCRTSHLAKLSLLKKKLHNNNSVSTEEKKKLARFAFFFFFFFLFGRKSCHGDIF